MLNAFLIYIIDLFKKKSRNFLTVSKALSNYCCVTPPPSCATKPPLGEPFSGFTFWLL